MRLSRREAIGLLGVDVGVGLVAALSEKTGLTAVAGQGQERPEPHRPQRGRYSNPERRPSRKHADHFGSIPELTARLPIRTFVDHGSIVETGERAVASFQTYAKAREKGRHIVAKPGDTVPIKGLDVEVVISGGAALTKPVAGAGSPNSLCRDFKLQEEDPTEDARSVGTIISLGRFRMLDLGDLTWNKEHDLVCPNNPLGTIDLYLATRHGINGAWLPVLVHAIRPRVAVINNAGMKGASREHFLTIRSSPGLEDIWQLHYSVQRPRIPGLLETTEPGGKELNTSEQFIANVDEATAHYLKISARPDGSFVVMNQRTGSSKEYKARS